MKKYFDYLLIYSIGGFILERIINIIFLGGYYDNSVLIGPYQPLYGSGILMAIMIKEYLIDPHLSNKISNTVVLILTAILTTAIAEAVTGFGFQYFYHVTLWDYSSFFPCRYPYVCVIPTSIFGIISFFVIKYIHPFIDTLEKSIPKKLSCFLFIIISFDIVFTLINF